MQTMGMCSTSFCNSTFLFTSPHYGSGSIKLCNNQKNTALSLSFPFNGTLLSSSLLPTHFTSLSVFPNKVSSKLRASAFKKGRKGGTALAEMDGSDEEEEEEEKFFDFDDELDGGDGDDDEGMFLPFGKMKKWLENKPRGFGEGKVYDTSIEDKLLEEIEQSRQVQIVNVNNLKNNPVKSGSKKDDKQNKKVAEIVPSGIRVKVINLPKKKNIYRDLKAAFNGVSGIINISPAVSGNKKTKDPVCKGFAFVDFKCEVDATRFVQNFSGNILTFGRIQKQIKCEMMNSLSRNPAHEELRDNGSMTPEVAVAGLAESENADFDMNNSSSNLSLESLSDEFDDQDDEFDGVDMNNSSSDLSLESLSDEFDDQADDIDRVELGEGRDDLNVISKSEPGSGDDMEQTLKGAADSISSDLSLESLSDEFDDHADEFDGVALGEGRDDLSVISKSEPGSGDDMERTFKGAADSNSSNQLERIRALEKKLLAKGKQHRVPKEQKDQKLERTRGIEKKLLVKGNQQKVPKEQKVQKLDIPGSAKRLKIKEKALLTGVFSKYGSKAAFTSKEES